MKKARQTPIKESAGLCVSVRLLSENSYGLNCGRILVYFQKRVKRFMKNTQPRGFILFTLAGLREESRPA